MSNLEKQLSWLDDHHWHSLSTDEVLTMLDGDQVRGLTQKEARLRLDIVGPNLLPKHPGPSAFIRFIQQFHHPLIYVLLVAGIVTLFIDHAVDAGVIFGVVLVNAIVGYLQESRAKAAIDALSQLITMETTVLRDGNTHRIDAAQLVPGDLVLLQSGDRIPADLRFIRLRELQVDESMLTGESLPVAKEIVALPEETSLADRKSLGFSGTLATFGQATGIVYSTGGRTELGRISHLIEEAESLETPLTIKLGKFSMMLTWVIISLAILTFLLGFLLRGQSPEDTFLAAIALAVAAIPEGLPAAVTIILAIGVTRMARREAVIRKLPAVETLGSTTVICSDKTGTLTKNEMTVTHVSSGGSQYTLTGTGYDPEGTVQCAGNCVDFANEKALYTCLRAGVLCNDSRIEKTDGLWRVIGDPTEGALITSAAKAGMESGEVRDQMPVLDSIPFESERQYMATLHEEQEHQAVIYVKGAVERVLALCDTMLMADGMIEPLDQHAMRAEAESMAANGLRVLAFAQRRVDHSMHTLHTSDLDHCMTFLGLQGMIDPPRPEAIEAVRVCYRAGISVKMITGDHALTAKTIARQMGIGGNNSSVMTGAELAAVAPQEFINVAARTDVFARVAPEQKLRLVEALQTGDGIVAMTGDGVNDAPALKQANIGIAMGQSGTEAAKDAADMILTDDNFASIAAAVEEGRGVYANLQKFITWTLPTNGGEGLLIIAAIAIGIAIPILPVHLLWINMTTALALGLMLAFEPKEPNLMEQPPRPANEPVLTSTLVLRTAYLSALMVIGAYLLYSYELRQGYNIHVARTIVANVIVLVETAYLFNCRSLTHPITHVGFFSNPWAIFGAGMMIGLQMLFIYLPFSQRLFSTAAIPANAWLHGILIAVAIYLIVEVEKWLRRRALAATQA